MKWGDGMKTIGKFVLFTNGIVATFGVLAMYYIFYMFNNYTATSFYLTMFVFHIFSFYIAVRREKVLLFSISIFILGYFVVVDQDVFSIIRHTGNPFDFFKIIYL